MKWTAIIAFAYLVVLSSHAQSKPLKQIILPLNMNANGPKIVPLPHTKDKQLVLALIDKKIHGLVLKQGTSSAYYISAFNQATNFAFVLDKKGQEFLDKRTGSIIRLGRFTKRPVPGQPFNVVEVVEVEIEIKRFDFAPPIHDLYVEDEETCLPTYSLEIYDASPLKEVTFFIRKNSESSWEILKKFEGEFMVAPFEAQVDLKKWLGGEIAVSLEDKASESGGDQPNNKIEFGLTNSMKAYSLPTSLCF